MALRRAATGLVLGVVAGAAGLWWAAGQHAETLMATRPTPSLRVPAPAELSAADLAEIRDEVRRADDELRERRRRFAAGSLSSASSGASIWINEEPPSNRDPLADVDLAELSHRRAVRRGEHVVLAVAGCPTCHGATLSGQPLPVRPYTGSLHAPPLRSVTAAALVRQLRHGVTPDGRTALAPCGGGAALSDRELTDAAAWLGSVSLVERPADPPPPSSVSRLGAAQVALGWISLPTQATGHQALPPDPSAALALGRHLLRVGCDGCHLGRSGLVDPGKARPLDSTGWTQPEFVGALVSGRRADGRPLGAGMPLAPTQAMSAAERSAVWTALEDRRTSGEWR